MPVETYGGKSKFLLVEGFQEPQMYYMKLRMGGEGVPQRVHLSMCLPSHTHTHTHTHSLPLSLSQGRKTQLLK